MYLQEVLIQNSGPLSDFRISMPFKADGLPKPLILVGQNGTGKTIFLSAITDALIEMAKVAGYTDVVKSAEGVSTPYFRFVGPLNQRLGTPYSLTCLKFSRGEEVGVFVEKTGQLDYETVDEELKNRFAGMTVWPINGNHKDVAI